MYKLLTLFTLFPLFCCKHCSSICSAKNNVGDKFGEFSRLVAINVKYAYQGAYLGAPNMVKWGVPEIGPSSQNLQPNLTFGLIAPL